MDRQNELKGSLLEAGFNLFGITPVSDYNRLVAEKNRISSPLPFKNLVIFGSGGKYFWEIFRKFLESPPGAFLNSSEDPIDNYTEMVANQLLSQYPELTDCLFPFKRQEIFIDYQKLAVCSGLGHLSPYIKLVLHPQFGSWISLRGVFLTGSDLQASGPLQTPVPCSDCSKPCLSVCPVNAVSTETFDFTVCAAYRDQETDCLSHCHVRKACIIGPEHAYSSEEGLHRNRASLKSIRSYFNLNKKT
jgi:hypothetical protein